MGKITILPEILCNQIAAGEVVERPAAVVKELVENSIDAGSSKISVSLLQGGRKEIRVMDNGCGMSQEDALLALERHATSKIRSVEDLQAIATLGFRGEAIPSIAAVSRFELVTKEPEAIAGVIIRIEGGVLKDVREKGCPAGTQICVRDLFHNVPARRKFLRTVETELAYISDQFIRIAVANPSIHMQLHSQERLLYDFPKSEGLNQRAGQVLGIDIARSLSPVESEKNGLRVHGFLSSPEIQRSNSQSLFLFVNGRPVWDRLLQRAVLTAYEALIPRGKFPVAVLFIEIPPMLVDVNVHPAKREIRFRNPGEVLGFVRETLLSVLSGLRPGSYSFTPQREGAFFSGKFPMSRFATGEPTSGPAVFRERQTAFDFRPSTPGIPAVSPPTTYVFPEPEDPPAETRPAEPAQDAPESPAPEAETIESDFSFSRLPVIGQLGNSFILLEAPDGLIIIDQHAAHERILFNTLGKQHAKSAQMLTRPAVFHLLPKEALLLKKWTRGLSDLGFEIEPFGGNSFAVHSVPAALSECRPEDILRDFLRFAEEESIMSESELLSGIAKIASCHNAVRAGQKLRFDEIKHLLESLDGTEVPFTCPHGRPITFKLTYDHIFKLFKRT